MCVKAYISVALYLVCIFSLTDGFFLPVFVRKQHPQTPAVNNAQWTSYQPMGSLSPLSTPSANGNLNVNGLGGNGANVQIQPSGTYKEYNPYQQQNVITPLHQVQITPAHNQQQGYETGNVPYQVAPYPQYQSTAFHSVQLVPCLCPISKDVIEQQTQQYQHSSAVSPSSSSSASTVESGNNEVSIKGNQKVNS